MGTRRRCFVLILALAPTGLTSLGCASARVPIESNAPAGDASHREVEPTAPAAVLGTRSTPEAALARLARTVDGLEWEIVSEGTIGIKAPDIWGQDRMTKSR